MNIKYLLNLSDLELDNTDQLMKKKLPKITNLFNINWNKVELIFFSLPNGEAQKIILKIIKRWM